MEVRDGGRIQQLKEENSKYFSGMIIALPTRMRFKKMSNRKAVLLVLLHAELESLETSVDEITIEWTGDGTDGVLEEADSFGQLIVVSGDGAHDDIGVTV